MPQKSKDPYIVIARLKKIIEFIEALRIRPLSVKQIAEKFDIGLATVYRYIKMLESIEELGLDHDVDDCYFIPPPEQKVSANTLDEEAMVYFKKLVHAAPRTTMKYKVMKQYNISDVDKNTTKVKLKIHVADFIEKLEKAMNLRRQVILKGYHSANSRKVSDRLVEPIHFGDDYQTIAVFDVVDKKLKHFKIDRISEIEIKRTQIKFTEFHQQVPTDVFGYTGKAIDCVTLQLSLRAFVKLREDFPHSAGHITNGGDHYIFKVPVFSYEGISVFVLSMLNDVKIIESKAFRDYILKRIEGHIL